ncbi:MAG: 50S ribosomal protein L6 [Candidatus Magasanikbacteria bacterium GW2011_GWC2_40_17]|uniref:Large ribosomal subunit protein uL6 n=1 Tax=Candidatus Magasanikbacteria bacterium GW2011_GWA2_42_32 TaxID=1619039 RepID=A0A0G1A754_9BACT|nr:MAG: 50S ribosomal protein L6 [Candidatus Magasanikbacteria bacterium GW2011_GWC2_40_17]KKS56789.1 MAG: 50S ribosomal protein L6 [Candidatus Magasanikbacteria bacterium GW2011_GWA2_42_32]OGH86025.1 MAG: 50S ribosomal protein L6 [Candidatus Magasanikbacteria bacterium RIFOXYB2_FULL_38_10]
MSRIGKKTIVIPTGVEADVTSGNIKIKGPKGTLEQSLHTRVSIVKEGNELKISVKDENLKSDRALWGLFGSLVRNMILGVTTGFEKKLEMNGIGFKAEVKGKNLVLDVGFSHQVNFAVPQGIEVTVEKNIITIKGFDKQLVGSIAAQIREIKKPEPYLGKGIKYVDEIIRRKAGKAAAKSAA